MTTDVITTMTCTMANVWREIDAKPSIETIGTVLQDVVWAMNGRAGHGLPLTLTKYDGTSYALDLQSAEATNGNTFRALSQNTLYGITLNNSRLALYGGITLAAYTQGGVLFAGPGGLLSQDVASLYWNDTTDKLGVGARGTTQPSKELHVFGEGLVESNFTSGGLLRAVSGISVGPTTGAVAAIDGTTGDIAAAGQLALTPSSAITTFKRQIVSTFTWSNGTTAMNAMTLALTDTSSGTTSSFFECLNGGVSKFLLLKSGAAVFGGGVAAIDGTPHPATGTGVEMYYVPGGAAGVLRAFDWSGATYKAMLLGGNPLQVGITASHSLGFYGSSGTVQQALPTAAATSASALTLVNSIRSALIAMGLTV